MLLLSMLIALSGCEKGEEKGIDGETIEGTGFLVTLQAKLPANIAYDNEEEPRSVASLADFLGNVTFAVFQNGQHLHISHQQSSQSQFGIWQVRLEPGIYQLLILAHNGTDHPTVSKPDEIKFANNKVTETFYAYLDLEVASDLSQTIVLERAVAKVQYYCKDPIPDNVAQMKFYYTGGSSTFNALTGLGVVNSRQTEYREITSEMIGRPTVFPIFTFPHDTDDQIKLTVTAIDSNGNELQDATYESIDVTLNEATVVEKYFFTQSDYQETTEIDFTLQDEGDWSQIDCAY